MQEIIWRSIPDFPRYEIANTGQIRNITTGKLLKCKTNPGRVQLHNDGGWKAINVFRLCDELFSKDEQRPH